MILVLETGQFPTNTIQHKPGHSKVEDVYKQYFGEYFDKLYAYAFTIVRSNSDAKDIVQTAFIKLWEKRNELRVTDAVRSYLYTTVYHLALNTVRDRKTRAAKMEQIEAGTEVNEFPSEQKEVLARIRQAVEALPPRCREVFCKSRMDGKKYAEIATELDISVKTVEAQMGKALKFLREQLSDLYLLLFLFFI